MATYAELHELASSPTLIQKITVAIACAAEDIRQLPEAAAERETLLDWAFRALQHPEGEAYKLVWAVLAQNKALTKVQINGASDANIQTAVNNAMRLFLR